MISKGLFGWSPPHIQPLTPVSEVSEPPESPSPYLDAGADAIEVNDDLPGEEGEEGEASFAAVPFLRLFDYATVLDWFLVALGTVAAVAHGLALPVYLHVLGKVLNLLRLQHLRHPDQSEVVRELAQHALYVVYIAAGSMLAGWIEVACWMVTAERQSSVIRSKYVQVLLNQDMSLFDAYGGSGDIVSQVSSDVYFIQYTLSDKVGHYTQNMATFVGGLVIGFLNSWQVSLATLATGPLIVAAGGLSNIFLHRLAESVQDAYSEAANIAEQAMAYVRTLYAFANEGLVKYLYANALRTTLGYGVQISRVQGIGLGFIYGLAICSCALQLWFGRSLVAHHHVRGGEIIAATFAIILSGLGLNQAATNFHAFEQSKMAAFRLFDMIQRVPAGAREGKTLVGVQGNLELRNVYFSYPSRPDIPILSGLYLNLPARKTMGLVGSSGSGKSSIISLIERFYDPTLGEVLLDGENIKNINVEWLRSQMGLVSSEPALLATTIRENILYGRGFSSMDEIEEAAKIAHAHAFISSLPHGYETQLGDGVLILSNELKLKIAIARAALKNPCILLLDECTSNLEPQAERVVQEALDILILGRSTMVVAHRLANIRNADVIAVFEEGQLVELGTHDELMGMDGTYADLIRLEDTTKPARRAGSYRESSNPAQAHVDVPDHLTQSGSNGMRFPDTPPVYGSPPQLLSPADEKASDAYASTLLDKIPSVKRQDSLEMALTSLPKLDMRLLNRHSSQQSDPESPVSPLLTTDPKNERSHSKTFARSFSKVMDRSDALASSEGVAAVEAGKPSLWRLAKLSSPEWFYAVLGSIGAALFGSFSPLLAFFVFRVTEKYYEAHNSATKRELNRWCLGVMGLGLLTVLVNFLQHFYFGIMGEKMTERIRRMMFSAILRNEIGWFDREENTTEGLSIRLANDATFVRAAFSNRLSILIQDTSAVIVTVLLGVALKWRLGVVVLATLPFLLLSAIAQRKWVMGFSESITASHKGAAAVVEEAVRNMYTVVAFCAGGKIVELYNRQLQAIQRRSFIYGICIGLVFGVSQLFLFACNAFILWYGSLLIRRNQSGLRQVLAVYSVVSFATFALVEPFGLAPYILKRRKSLVSVFGIIDRKPQIDPDSSTALKLPNIYGTLELRNVDFSYPTRPDAMIFRNLNLKATGGQTVAVVGASGSGKSTLIALIERFYDPQSGSVMLDGKDIRSLNLRWLRSNIGLVQQEPILFSTTIRENIIYAKRSASEGEMKEAARIANAHHFISSLPHGYDTHIGMRGLELSTGQKQRIAIARVVLKNAPLLLLDEASSAIESESSRVVQEALDTLIMGNKTAIIVAHRIAMLKRVDMIAVLHEGHFCEQGSHDTLMEQAGLYARLMQPHLSKPLRQHLLY